MLKIKTAIKHKIELDEETTKLIEEKRYAWVNTINPEYYTQAETEKKLHEYDSYLKRIIKAAFDKGYKLGKEEKS